MEINALFDLWDQFSNVGFNSEAKTTEQFYNFAPGTDINEILNWFPQQNPFFEIGQEPKGNNSQLVAYCNPKRDD